ncbi:molybdenum cofactor biosynthesis protein MoaE [Candidatus Bathyarchaeota archaeon]|nr:MAG: molybdenum cofactor biosynthesis protein MoaE [Candidatus Bathyarchaeota archaeon]
MIKLIREEPSIDEALQGLRLRRVGAVSIFVGIVRGETGGRVVEALEIEAYDEMALREMERIRVEALKRFKVEEVAILHRVGRLKVGEIILIILVAAAHRDEAFKACRYVLEELKRRVPLWKREITPMGATWVEGEGVEGC